MYRDNRHRIRRIFFVIEELTDKYKFPVNEKNYMRHERVRCATKHGNKRGRLIPNTYKYCSFGFYRYIYCPLRINMHITEYGVRGVLESKADRWIFPNTRNRASITIKVSVVRWKTFACLQWLEELKVPYRSFWLVCQQVSTVIIEQDISNISNM